MLTRKRLLAVCSGALLLVALVAGTALAQTPTPQDNAQPGKANYREVFLDRLASLLNVTRDQLNDAAKQAAQDTVDQAEKNGDLTADQAAKLKERAQSGNFGFPGFLGRGHGRAPAKGMWLGDHQAIMAATAQALGLTSEELMSQLKAGKSVADLAQERNVSADTIKKAIADAVGQNLDQAVKDGKLTQQQADSARQRLESMPADSFLQGRGFAPKGMKGTPNGGARFALPGGSRI